MANKNKKSFIEIYNSLTPAQQSTYHHVLLGTSRKEYAAAEGISIWTAGWRRQDLFKRFNVRVTRGYGKIVDNNVAFINHILSITK